MEARKLTNVRPVQMGAEWAVVADHEGEESSYIKSLLFVAPPNSENPQALAIRMADEFNQLLAKGDSETSEQ